jgi:putative hydrolase
VDGTGGTAGARDPVADLREIAFRLERAHEPTYRVRAFRTAAAVLADLGPAEVARRAGAGTLTELTGIGKATAAVVTQSLAGVEPDYLTRLPAGQAPVAAGGEDLRAALRGDLHTHSDWSDGGSPIEEMMAAARRLGHSYTALTDHSPRLTVARGLTAERLAAQLDLVERLNADLDGDFQLLTGIEVDILDDGSLDQSPELLSRLDIVVASVHSGLRQPAEQMTPRMVAAVANPHVDVLGHCTGRLLRGTPGESRRPSQRPESEFDAELVFEACRRFGVAVEINSRPERLDPPTRLLKLAVQTGCLFSVDTDAHAPGQLDWQPYGCERAEACGVPTDSVVNTWELADLLAWTADHTYRPEP